jgi:hypothetical protein
MRILGVAAICFAACIASEAHAVPLYKATRLDFKANGAEQSPPGRSSALGKAMPFFGTEVKYKPLDKEHRSTSTIRARCSDQIGCGITIRIR